MLCCNFCIKLSLFVFLRSTICMGLLWNMLVYFWVTKTDSKIELTLFHMCQNLVFAILCLPIHSKKNSDCVIRVKAVVRTSEQSSTLLVNSFFPYDKREQLDDEGKSDLVETI